MLSRSQSNLFLFLLQHLLLLLPLLHKLPQLKRREVKNACLPKNFALRFKTK